MKRSFAWVWGTATMALALVLAFSVVIGVPRVLAQEATPGGEEADACAEVMAAAAPDE